MIEIIPSINVQTFEELQEKVKMVEPYVSWVHLDVADGSFTDVTMWHNPRDLLQLHTPLFVEVHLMLDHIDERIHAWLKPNVRRVIFHREASKNPDTVITQCHEADTQAGMAMRPDTPVEKVMPYLSKVDLVQTLTVMPGPAGQKFKTETLAKISAFRAACPTCPIEVDGGVDKETAPRIVRAGATILVAATAIFENKNIEQAINDLKRSLLAVPHSGPLGQVSRHC